MDKAAERAVPRPRGVRERAAADQRLRRRAERVEHVLDELDIRRRRRERRRAEHPLEQRASVTYFVVKREILMRHVIFTSSSTHAAAHVSIAALVSPCGTTPPTTHPHACARSPGAGLCGHVCVVLARDRGGWVGGMLSVVVVARRRVARSRAAVCCHATLAARHERGDGSRPSRALRVARVSHAA